ncbi:MAG: tryptophan synthase subunit alpha [bacterium]|nr:tryptophan synthase subunit alpha [bacterium]
MTPNRIDAAFSDATAPAGPGNLRLLPYLTAGHPDLGVTAELVRRLDALGVAAIEIGFPFSDSIADGPIIQDSFHRALATGFRVGALFDAIAALRGQVQVPLVAMVSYSIVTRLGAERFCNRAAEAGFDGLIAPDLPLEEAGRLAELAADRGLKNVMLVSTTTPADRCGRIVERCTGFVYQIAVAGITGERRRLADELPGQVARLRTVTDLPICVGFGIGTPEQARQAAEVADGVIVGSAIVRRMTEALEAGHGSDRIVEDITAFVGQLQGTA